MQENKKNKIIFKIILSFLIAAMLFSLNVRTVSAVGPTATFELSSIPSDIKTALEKAWSAIAKAYKASGSKILNTVARTALKQMAYDTATWLGSGKEGQKPLFLKEGWGKYLGDIGDNAAGQFIGEMSAVGQESWTKKFNICKPSLDFKVQIGLGLVGQTRPGFAKPDCTASEMVESWKTFGKGLKGKFEGSNWMNFLDISATGGQTIKKLISGIGDAVAYLRDTDFKKTKGEVEELMKELLDQIGKLNSNVKSQPRPITEAADEAISKTLRNIEKKFPPLLRKLDEWDKQVNIKELAEKTDMERKQSLNALSTGIQELIKEMKVLRDKLPSATNAPGLTDQKLADLSDSDFLSKFQGYFDPSNNEIGQALTLLTGITAKKEKEKEDAKKDREEAKGWLDLRNIGGFRTSPPGTTEEERNATSKAIKDKTVWDTGDAFVDAANVFLNQLAITSFNKMMRKLGEKKPTTDPKNCLNDPSLCGLLGDKGDYESEGYKGGITDMKNRSLEELKPGKQVNYDDILVKLVMCSDPTKAGPTDCVIEQDFSEAIRNGMLVGEAMKMNKGLLKKDWVFGFDKDGKEPSYIEGYPYRSMLILKKFRIIPVGWELASQYIKDGNPRPEGSAGGSVTLGDVVACFDKDDEYEGYYEKWCEGLVDPTWVLKAPLNSCMNMGYGPEIQTYQTAGNNQDSKLMIVRNDQYCADEQSCIKEKSNGSCEKYGNCVEDKRIWNFEEKSCDPNFNTCQTFINNNKTVSYLENTLDYCSATEVGCKDYCADYDYKNEKWICDYDSGNKFYFNSQAQECSAENEACSEFIRTGQGWGTNLLANSSFEVVDESIKSNMLFDESLLISKNWSDFGTTTDGVIGLQLTENVDAFIPINILDGERFSFSFYSKNCDEGGEFGIQGNNFAKTATTTLATSSLATSTDDWMLNYVNYLYPVNAFTNKIGIFINGNNCVIDKIKLERGGDIRTYAYTDYGKENLIYEKLVPNYLASLCSSNNPPAECNKFAQKCKAEEDGCELYTSTSNNMSIAGKVSAYDYCPKDCDGYDLYIQEETAFDSLKDEYFIPSTAQTCSASVVGCDEFTNLDKIEQGGESKEYYSYLRQCVKANDPKCAEFYTWEGDNETGHQLRTHILQASSTGDLEVTENDSASCTSTIYRLPPTDPLYNSDCREFYNKQGQIFYHLYSRTISCSDDCHPYRKTQENTQITDQGVCKNKGVWDDQHKACIYKAIPGEGMRCSANQAGCREYSGNKGNNTRIVLNDDFETGNTQGWEGINGTASSSSEALTAGGSSLLVNSGKASTTVSGLIDKTSNYTLSFLLKPKTATATTAIYFVDSNSDKVLFNSAQLKYDWNLYQVNLKEKFSDNHEIESLIIEANGSFYIDNIRLTQIIDQYYLIKNSWEFPADVDADGNDISVCDWDSINEKPEAYYSLGCSAYKDRGNSLNYLRRFTRLCKDNAVGCELMINTHNYSNYYGNTWHDASSTQPGCQGDSCVEVKKDNFIYAIYDKTKQCNADDKGCQFLGSPYKYENQAIYSGVYLKNNPDKYDTILCGTNGVGCQAWTSGQGKTYFKDPRDMVCEWRQDSRGKGKWLKKKVKKCVGTDNVCLSNKDCAECKTDEKDYLCDVDEYKTIGFGSSAVYQPTNNWAGICNESEAGCTEYIDPVSKFATNIILNFDFSQADPNNLTVANKWNCTNWMILEECVSRSLFRGDCTRWRTTRVCVSAGGVQNVKLEKNTLYILAVEGNNTATINAGANNNIFYELDSNNKLTGPVSTIVASTTANRVSKRFYTATAFTGNIQVANITPSNNNKVELKKAIVNYQLKQDIAEKESCNSIVNFETGCVLFNERTIKGSDGLASLLWDADLTINDGINGTSTASSANNNVNLIIKVKPDRTCDKWLDCKDIDKIKVGEKEQVICKTVGICNKLYSNGECSEFINVEPINQTYLANVFAKDILNMTGYAKVGYYATNTAVTYPHIVATSTISIYPNDYLLLGSASTIPVGLIANVPNGGFEFSNDEGYASTTPKGKQEWKEGFNLPVSWIASSSDKITRPDINSVRVISNPVEAQREQICYKKDKTGQNCLVYAPEGRKFLKLMAGCEKKSDGKCIGGYGNYFYVSSSEIPVVGNKDYIISAYIDTSNLSDGKAVIKVKEFNSSDAVIVTAPTTLIELGVGQPWTFKLGKFTTDPNTAKIKIYLQATNDSQGSYYFDDVKIRPGLRSKTKTVASDFWYTPQSCRLYPMQDSLSCDYEEDTGVRYKGWYGHCLEYDRYPGDTDACLLWWNVPPNTHGVNEYCGDGYVNGQEDCDCPQKNGKAEPSCSVLDALPKPNFTGINNKNQYKCVNCRWADGWCGDNNVQTTGYNEECDWNDSGGGANFDNQSCWSNPKNNSKYNHDGYTDYLHGTLGCYNNSGVGKKCELDFSNNKCSDNLVNNKHTRKNCIDAGGVVWAENGIENWQVTATTTGKIIGTVGNKTSDGRSITYFCKFNGSWSGVPSAIIETIADGNSCRSGCEAFELCWYGNTPYVCKCSCPGPSQADTACQDKGSGWKQYENWSKTEAKTCIGESEYRIDYGDSSDNGWDDHNCVLNEMFQTGDSTDEMPGLRKDGYGHGYVRGTSAYHDIFESKTREACSLEYHWDKESGTTGRTWANCTAYATVTEIGCY